VEQFGDGHRSVCLKLVNGAYQQQPTATTTTTIKKSYLVWFRGRQV